MTILSKCALFALLAIVPTLLSSAQAADPIGKVAAFRGTASASGTGGARELERGSALYAGDTVRASGGGNVQILLNDGTRLVVGPASQLVLEAYLLRNENTASKVAVKALRGYFRFISGNSAKSAYSISTPSATIGIRGTGLDIRVRNLTLAAVTEGIIRIRGGNGEAVNAAAGCGVAEAGRGSTDARLLEGRLQANRLRQDFPMLFNQASFLAQFRLDVETCQKVLAAHGAVPTGGGGGGNTGGSKLPDGGQPGDGFPGDGEGEGEGD